MGGMVVVILESIWDFLNFLFQVIMYIIGNIIELIHFTFMIACLTLVEPIKTFGIYFKVYCNLFNSILSWIHYFSINTSILINNICYLLMFLYVIYYFFFKK